MPTRASAAKEAAFIASSVNVNSISTPPFTPMPTRAVKKVKVKSKPACGGDGQDYGVNESNNSPAAGLASLPIPAVSAKRKKTRAAPKRTQNSASKDPVKGGWDELPHNIGKIDGIGEPSAQGDGAPEVNEVANEILMKQPESGVMRKNRGVVPVRFEDANAQAPETVSKKKSRRTEAFKTEAESSGLTKIKLEIKGEDIDNEDGKPKKKRAPRVKTIDTSSDVQKKVDQLLEIADKPVKRAKKGKKNPYGLTPGETPFPNFAMPTIEASNIVNELLAEVHGKVEPPREIPAPSLEVTGCGEVPSVLDALIRTRLSASTTSTNAGYAFAGLVERYDVLKEGIGAGSVDWNAVRESPVEDIEKAIVKGGLAKTKSKSIKTILEMVYQHNITRYTSFIKERDLGVPSDIPGAEKLTKGQKDLEISTREKGVLSLDYMHGLTAEEAMMEFVQYPGIGVKTASCVILFCLRRPSFAVDTHVWRFCKWLKWVPEGATRDQTFSHCEVRVPSELKYPLHQLLIRHGKTCGRCRAATGEGSENWENTVCPIEHLVERTGKRKGGAAAANGDDEDEDDNGRPKKKKKMVKKVMKAKVPQKATKDRKRSARAVGWESDTEMDGEMTATPELDDNDSEMSELSEPEESSD